MLHNYSDLESAKRSARTRRKRGELGFEVFHDDPKLLGEAIDDAHAEAAIHCALPRGDIRIPCRSTGGEHR